MLTRNGTGGKIFAYVWCDVEEYMNPKTNDPPLQAAKILKKYNVPVTYKLVAEKVRFLKEQKRQDVISAINNYCDVGYHTDTHSRHPVTFEYISTLDVLNGAKEIEKRERRGLRELKNTFSRVPSCFGHAGLQFAPHYNPWLKKVGIPVYLDETKTVNMGPRPYWYCGILSLTVSCYSKNFICFDYTYRTPDGNLKLKKRFKTIHDRLKKQGGGVISIEWHTHTAVNKVFWDRLNFANGRNTPKEKYVRSKEHSPRVKKRAFEDFERFVKFVSSFEDVEFISASDARRIYQRKLKIVLGIEQIREIARTISGSNKISYLKLWDEYISPAQAFGALTQFIASYSKTKRLPKRAVISEPLGPMAPFKAKTRTRKLSLSDLLSAAEKVSRTMEKEGYMPSSIAIGNSAELAPSDFLATLAHLTMLLIARKPAGEYVSLQRASMILGEKFVDSTYFFERASRWRILPRRFKAPKILEQTRLQTWTLVPAVPKVG